MWGGSSVVMKGKLIFKMISGDGCLDCKETKKSKPKDKWPDIVTACNQNDKYREDHCALEKYQALGTRDQILRIRIRVRARCSQA